LAGGKFGMVVQNLVAEALGLWAFRRCRGRGANVLRDDPSKGCGSPGCGDEFQVSHGRGGGGGGSGGRQGGGCGQLARRSRAGGGWGWGGSGGVAEVAGMAQVG